VAEGVSVAIVNILKSEKRCRCVDGLCANIYGWCYCGDSLQRRET
jgi:hypothetical protein